MSKPRLIERARDFAASAGAIFAVAGAIERGRKPARADLERIGIEHQLFFFLRCPGHAIP